MDKPVPAAKSDKEKPIVLGDASATPRYYCNNALITASQWDFVFNFYELVNDPRDESKVSGIPRAIITMSPQHAKALLAILKNTVEQWDAAVAVASSKAGKV